jgi:hypothetical protein
MNERRTIAYTTFFFLGKVSVVNGEVKKGKKKRLVVLFQLYISKYSRIIIIYPTILKYNKINNY